MYICNSCDPVMHRQSWTNIVFFCFELHLTPGPTSLLRGQLVKCSTTSYPNTLMFFVEKKRVAFAFLNKNIGVFQISTFKILTKH